MSANDEQCVHGALEFAKDLWEADEPALWHKDLTGELKHWIEVGQPDDKRLMKASGRTDSVSVYSFSNSTPIWWSGIATKITRAQIVNAIASANWLGAIRTCAP